MLHPALRQALATAHIDDLHRAAAAGHTIRLARRPSARTTRRDQSNRDRAIRPLIVGLKPRESQAGVRRK